jgi:hypothetical protein
LAILYGNGVIVYGKYSWCGLAYKFRLAGQFTLHLGAQNGYDSTSDKVGVINSSIKNEIIRIIRIGNSIDLNGK